MTYTGSDPVGKLQPMGEGQSGADWSERRGFRFNASSRFEGRPIPSIPHGTTTLKNVRSSRSLASLAAKQGLSRRAGPVLLTQGFVRIPAAFGHRFRFDPDRNPVDVGQRSGVCRTGFRRHPDSNPGRSGQSSGPIRTTFRGIRTVLGAALSGAVARDRE